MQEEPDETNALMFDFCMALIDGLVDLKRSKTSF